MLEAAASRPYHRKVSKSKSAPPEMNSPPQANEEEDEQVPLRSDMSTLIVYCKTVPYKPNSPSLNCNEMHSFNENNAMTFGEDCSRRLFDHFKGVVVLRSQIICIFYESIPNLTSRKIQTPILFQQNFIKILY